MTLIRAVDGKVLAVPLVPVLVRIVRRVDPDRGVEKIRLDGPIASVQGSALRGEIAGLKGATTIQVKGDAELAEKGGIDPSRSRAPFRPGRAGAQRTDGWLGLRLRDGESRPPRRETKRPASSPEPELIVQMGAKAQVRGSRPTREMTRSRLEKDDRLRCTARIPGNESVDEWPQEVAREITARPPP